MYFIDSEKDRSFLLELFNQTNFPGRYLDFAYEVKQKIVNAKLTETLAVSADNPDPPQGAK